MTVFQKPFYASFLGALLLSASAFSAEPEKGKVAGVFPNGMCWNKKIVEVHFNPALAVELENPFNRVQPFPSAGSTADRKKAMQLAIDDWNTALANLGAVVRLKLVETKSFAGRQGPVKCFDPDFRGEAVHKVDYARHYGDGDTVGSTAEPNMSGRKGLGAGWVTGENPASHDIDKRLAETGLAPRPDDDATEIREADIMWFTHVTETETRCPAIRWNYVPSPMPVAAPYFDFYSVMLHELGHLLGLDHQSTGCGAPGGPNGAQIRNVMHPMIDPGMRTSILRCEMNALRALYGKEMRCGNPAK